MVRTGDPGEFYEFEHRGWEEVARRYDNSWALVTRQAIEPLLNAAHVGSNTRVLDVACGPGYTAGAAAARGAIASGVDFSSEMVALARSQYPGVEFREGDAESLPFADSLFNAVVLNFGILHLAEPERAFSESFRVRRSGGRIAFTVWDMPDHAIGHAIVLGAVRQHGDIDVPLPAGPPFFRFSDPAECRRVLLAEGFSNPGVSKVALVWQLFSSDALFDIMVNSSVRNAALLRAQRPEALDAIRTFMRREVSARQNVLPMAAVLASAQKP
jgi:SAM-dependent methyltransferase